MEEAIRENGLEVAGGGAGGSSFWMRAPDNVDAGELAQRLIAEGVLIENGTPFFPGDDARRNYYRLAYSSIPAERISEGIGLIARAIANS